MKQTQLLKGTLEGCVRAIISEQDFYGCQLNCHFNLATTKFCFNSNLLLLAKGNFIHNCPDFLILDRTSSQEYH
ncbi:hypothetical protein [Liquorilactobacillus sicerae]|uniref:hypothetical protein n=1 Tax=Liquorilactobacillus sicerae TaxID=1416943 RepID=UPI002480B439|nr:hypothetical protein [Liquorilactobacillus sicerae]